MWSLSLRCGFYTMEGLSALLPQLDDMLAGRGDWTNVQAPVRLALVALLKAVAGAGAPAPDPETPYPSSSASAGAAGFTVAGALSRVPPPKPSVWKELALIREDLATRCTRTEVHDSLRVKADRSEVQRLRLSGEDDAAELLRSELKAQRETHLRKHDRLLRADLEALGTRVKHLADRFRAVQFEARFEGLEARVGDHVKRRRRTADDVAKLSADVRAVGKQGAESASLFLGGVARLRETLERVAVQLEHKADSAEMRGGLAAKADAADVEALRGAVAATGHADRCAALERRLDAAEQAARDAEVLRTAAARSHAAVRADLEALEGSLRKEVVNLGTALDATQAETASLRHDGTARESAAERASAAMSRRVAQCEEAAERAKPRVHDLTREVSRLQKHQEAQGDKLDHVVKGHRQLAGTQVATLARDVERLKKTMVQLERAQHHAHPSDHHGKKGAAGAGAGQGTGGEDKGASAALRSQIDEVATAVRSCRRDLGDQVRDAVRGVDALRRETEGQVARLAEAQQKAAAERSTIDDRCSALELGVRHSLAVLSRPPSVKSSANNNARGHHQHSSYPPHHRASAPSSSRPHSRASHAYPEKGGSSSSTAADGNSSHHHHHRHHGGQRRHRDPSKKSRSRRSSRRSSRRGSSRQGDVQENLDPAEHENYQRASSPPIIVAGVEVEPGTLLGTEDAEGGRREDVDAASEARLSEVNSLQEKRDALLADLEEDVLAASR